METVLGVCLAAIVILTTAALIGVFAPARGPRRGPAFRTFF